MILAKCTNKWFAKSLNFKKITYYQKWKKFALNSQASSYDRITSVFSEIVTSSEDFNRCVEDDCYLSKIINEKLFKMVDLVSSDILYFTPIEKTGMMQLKGYHYQSGEQANFN